MISKMSKYSFLVYHGEFIRFLETLRKTGVVHVKEKSEGIPDDEDIAEKIKLQKQISETIKFLNSRKIEQADKITEQKAPDIIVEIEQLRENIETENSNLQSIEKKINQLKPWGDFSWQTIEKLQKFGRKIFFYSCNKSKFNPLWQQNYNVFVISKHESYIYFIVVEKEKPEIEADLLKLPSESFSTLTNNAQQATQKIESFENQINNFAANSISVLEKYKQHIESEIDFKTVTLNASDQADAKVKILEGWVPEQNEDEITRALENEGVFYVKSTPSLNEKVPVLLKNNAFTKLFEMVGSLYSLPDYREIDLTPFFAPFFMLFFGFCLGDAGYGLLIMLATLVMRGRVKQSMKPVMSLGFFFGLATFIMGIIGGTFFGIMLVDLNIGWFNKLKAVMLDQNQLMIFAIILGIVQIVFGILLKAVRLTKMKGFKYAISTIGWLIIIIGVGGSFALGNFGVIASNVATPVMIATGTIGAAMALLYNSPEKNIFLNFGLGLWDTYSMVTGLLGDVLSYIRLFALGLSSAILGNVFNQLAFELTGNIPVVSQLLTVLILLLGHAINFFMAALGAFVHPLRLTFVEFFKNTGFEGGGIKYRPFSEIDEAKQTV